MNKHMYFQQSLLTTTFFTRCVVAPASVMVLLMGTSGPAHAVSDTALPTGGSVVSGSATFDYGASNLNINQSSNNAVIDWSTFDVGKDASTQFNQPTASSIAVNVVKDVKPSQILGSLKSNGQLVVLNANGVFFGKDSQVDVGGLLASTGQIDVDTFNKSGKVNLSNINTGGKVENQGHINVRNAGIAAFVAPEVSNSGVIEANLGKIVLASGGDRATVDLYGDNLVELQLDGKTSKALIDNTGTLKADGGKIAITAKAAAGVVDSTVNLGGIVEANTVGVHNGRIILSGTNTNVNVTGKVNAKGGKGQIDVRSDKNIKVAKSAELNADAGTIGNGGTVTLVAEEGMSFSGKISARGGSVAGNGGEAEISGHKYLGFDGLVDMGAHNGTLGSLLLDPAFAIIHDGSVPAGWLSSYVISAADLALSMKTTNVTVAATDYIDVGTNQAGYTNQNWTGNAVQDAAITTGLNALNDGVINLNIWDDGVTTGTTAGSLTLNSNTVNFNRDLTLGNGHLAVTAPTVNLNAQLYDVGGLMTQSDITTTASTVNVLSNQALIQQGIYVANTGATVNVGAGTYAESVKVAKTVTLKGAKAGLEGVDGARGTGESIIAPHSPGFLVTANNAVVDGFTIQSADNGIFVNGANNVQLKNNIIKDSSNDGIYLFNSKNSSISGNLIQDTTADGVRNSSRYGIYVHGSQNASVTNNNVSNSRWDGIFVSSTNGVTLDSNTVYSVNDDGIDIEGTIGTIRVTNNNVSNTGNGFIVTPDQSNGIELTTTKNAFVDGNVIQNTSGDGIWANDTSGVIISNNVVADGTADGIANAALHGIYVQNVPGAQVLNNDISGVHQNGIFINGGSSNLVSGNTISHADLHGIYAQNTPSTRVLSNDISSVNGDGIYVKGGSANLIDGNIITNVSQDGIYLFGNKGSTINNNVLQDTNGDAWNNGSRIGIYAHGSQKVNVTNNSVSGSAWDGIVSSSVDGINIDSNTVNHVNDDGVDVEGTFGAINIVNNIIDNTGHGLASGDQNNGIELSSAAYATIQNNRIGQASGSVISGNGIQVDRSNATRIKNNTISTLGNGIVLMGSGNDSGLATTTVLLDNTVTAGQDGGVFESGKLDFQGTNTFNFTRDGLVFSPTSAKTAGSLALVGDTLGTTKLNDTNFTGYFIRLANGAFFAPGTPTLLNAQQVTFNDPLVFHNFVPGSGPLPVLVWWFLENRIHDYDDDNTLGQFFFASTTTGAPDQNSLLPAEYLGNLPDQSGSVTILGLPTAGGAGPTGGTAAFFANISPAAGGDDNGTGGSKSADALNALEPAAGGDKAGCWDQVYSHFGQPNKPVTFSLSDDADTLLQQQADCAQKPSDANL